MQALMAPILAILSPFLALVGVVWSAVKLAALGLHNLALMPLEILLRLPVLAGLRKRVTHEHDPIRWLEREACKAAPESLLVRGKRREYAESIASPGRYPTLYAHLPADLDRSIVSDGRLLNGMAPAAALAGNAITDRLIVVAYRHAVRDGIRAAWIAMVLGSLLAALWVSMPSQLPAMPVLDMPVAEGQPVGRDIWGQADLEALSNAHESRARAVAVAQRLARFVSGLGTWTLYMLAVGVLSASVGRLVWFGRFRGLVHACADRAVAGLRANWREALQRWRYRLETRELEYSAFARAVSTVETFDRSPLVRYGRAQGIFEFRGALGAPTQGGQIAQSILDLSQHVLVLGASGEGKTRDVAVPVLRQLLQLRQQGYPVGLYATDGKGVLWSDVVAEARSAGCEGDLRIIGTMPGQLRVDLLDGTPPTVVSDIIKSVARQLGGPAADDFWPDMAAQLTLETAILCQAWELTDAGTRWILESGYRAYSLRNIMRVASSDELLSRIIADILSALKDPAQYPRLAQFDSMPLYSAIEGQIDSWMSMAEATKSGILANARKALRLFAFDPLIAHGFADGSGPGLLSVSELLGSYLVTTNVSAIEHGAAGKLVCVMLKTLLFREARLTEARDPKASKQRMAWWSQPDLSCPVDPRYAMTIFMADEYQDLVTSDPAAGLSDATFWNVARTSGICGFVMTQGMTALQLAIGHDAASNMANNFRTKIFLRCEDLATIDYARKLAGKATRYVTIDHTHAESSVAARREWGADSNADCIVEPDIENIAAGPFGKAFELNDLSIRGYDELSAVDLRFVPSSNWLGDDQVQRLSAEQAAFWRQEDLTRAALTQGAAEADVLSESDVMQMGRGRAVCYVQRAGITRSDIIQLSV